MDWTTTIAIYGAFTGSVALYLQYRQYRRDTKHSLIVRLSIRGIIVAYGNQLGSPSNVLSIQIVNDSAEPKYIERPGLEIDFPVDGQQLITFFNPNDPTNPVKTYPLMLDKGAVNTEHLAVIDFLHHIQNSQVTKVRAVVQDTTGKLFKSDWINLDVITEAAAL